MLIHIAVWRVEARKEKSLPGMLQWTSWPNIVYADIYNYLILLPGMSHEKLKAIKSLDGYNQFINGWVYLFVIISKHIFINA